MYVCVVSACLCVRVYVSVYNKEHVGFVILINILIHYHSKHGFIDTIRLDSLLTFMLY